MWWIDETPWPGPPVDLVQIIKPGELYRDPQTNDVKGIVMRVDCSLHPTAAGLGRQIRLCYTVMVDSTTGSRLEFTEYFPEDEVDWSPDATQVF